MEQEQKELEKIESELSRFDKEKRKSYAVWDEIAMQIHSYTGKKQEYWGRVMDLYNKKYKN